MKKTGNQWNKNGEGYMDLTAGMALCRVAKEERRQDMGRKRNCRRTVKENIIHEKAVKMRKMTDAQLVHYVEEQVEKARSEGFNQGKAKASPPLMDIQAVIDEIGGVKGIGETKLCLIKEILKKRLGGAAVG